MSEPRVKGKGHGGLPSATLLKRRWLAVPMLLLALSLTAWAGAPKPDIPKAVKGKQCVEDTDFMRRNHMKLLMHQRDDTVHLGIRSPKHSLKNCFTCHVVKDENNRPVTAADPRHFCRECHDYAAVKVDCFQCHASTPPSGDGGSL